MFPILYYHGLDKTGLKSKLEKVIGQLQAGDFKSADVKKLKPSGYLRAKLDDTNRLLFMPIKANGRSNLLILEIIKNHDYQKSRFLSGAEVKEENILKPSFDEKSMTQLKVSDESSKVHLLDKFIAFDQSQQDILQYPLPLVVIGSAGSGKTSVTLEKLKSLNGDLLYTSLSSFLVSHTQKVYYSHNYTNDKQEIDFLSFTEFLETIHIPKGKEITSQVFMQWFSKQAKTKFIQDGRKLFEEFRGVITGSEGEPYLDESSYLELGIKQSIYADNQRKDVYKLFKKYLGFLAEGDYYDSNILASEYQVQVVKKYDAVVIDEVQDLTNIQLSLILKSLKQPGHFLLCGDANQIVHPNFFSWSKLKSYFYQGYDLSTHSITRILTKNYRNTLQVTELANRVLKLKNYRFGSIDKESHYLVESVSLLPGEVSCLPANAETTKEISKRTAKSVNYAVLVLHDSDKAKARLALSTPLIFTAQEAKGLEYENIILFNFISSDARYLEIAKGVSPDFINQEFNYSRAKNKADKALEVYKFYVNALYVAITRSVKNVYLLEDKQNHPFIRLLEINEIQNINIKSEQSSDEAWQKEASKLAMQGKDEQASAIEEQILRHKKPAWGVMDKKEFLALKEKVIVNKSANKREQIKLLNYAIIYNDNDLIDLLQARGVKAANNINKCINLMEDEYFREYLYRNNDLMHQNIKNFGIEFRNQFNLTPLMCAAYAGNDAKAKSLIELGSSVEEVDNNKRTPLMLALSKAERDIGYAQHKLSSIYFLLTPEAISVQINERLVKINYHQAEFFLLLYMMTSIRNLNLDSKRIAVFDANRLSLQLRLLPNNILPEFRKKRQYISSILSKSEIDSNSIYSKKIFRRVRRGVYALNEKMLIKIKDKWESI